MKLLGIDFETNGPEPKTCDITEASWILYDTDFGKVPIVSSVYLNKDVVEMDPGAQKVTGITLERCHKYGVHREEIKNQLQISIAKHRPDFLVAHNAYGFDKIIFDRIVPEEEEHPWRICQRLLMKGSAHVPWNLWPLALGS